MLLLFHACLIFTFIDTMPLSFFFITLSFDAIFD